MCVGYNIDYDDYTSMFVRASMSVPNPNLNLEENPFLLSRPKGEEGGGPRA